MSILFFSDVKNIKNFDSIQFIHMQIEQGKNKKGSLSSYKVHKALERLLGWI